MPLGIVEIDDVDRGDAGDVVQSEVIVEDFVAGFGDELFFPQFFGGIPVAADEFGSVFEAVAFLINGKCPVADHVDDDPPDVAIFRGIIAVFFGEILGAEEVFALVSVDEFFAVEEDEVDAVGGIDVLDVVSKLHEERDATGTVVGPDE